MIISPVSGEHSGCDDILSASFPIRVSSRLLVYNFTPDMQFLCKKPLK